MKWQLTRVQQILILIVAVAAGFYFYLSKVYDPVMNEYKAVSQELMSLRDEVLGRDLAAGSKNLEERIKKSRQEIENITNRLSAQTVLKKAQSDSEVTEALAEINRLALSCGMDVIKLESKFASEEKVAKSGKPAQSGGGDENAAVMVAEEAGNFDWREYQVVYSGDGAALINFIEKKMKANYLVLIDNAKIDRGEEKGKDAGKNGEKDPGTRITVDLLI